MEATSTTAQAPRRTTFECKRCRSTFTSVDDLRQHVWGHIRNVRTKRDRRARRRSPRPPPSEPDEDVPLLFRNSASFKCPVGGCQYITDDRESCWEHLGSHRETSDSRCAYCGETFDSTRTLLEHTVTFHEQRPFRCGLCSYDAVLPIHIVLHWRWYHADTGLSIHTREAALLAFQLTPRPREQLADRSVEPYRCAVDGFKTIRPDSFELHLTNVHSNLEKFDCFVCRLPAGSPKALLEHSLQHNLGALMCGLCRHCELSLKAMLKHHCDHHPDGSLQIVFRSSQLRTEFERFIAKFGQMSTCLPQPGCVHENSPHMPSCRTPPITREQALPPTDTSGRGKRARERSSRHNFADSEPPVPESSPHATPREQCRHPASHEQEVYVVGLEGSPKRIPLSVFTQRYNIEVHVAVRPHERRLALDHLDNL